MNSKIVLSGILSFALFCSAYSDEMNWGFEDDFLQGWTASEPEPYIASLSYSPGYSVEPKPYGLKALGFGGGDTGAGEFIYRELSLVSGNNYTLTFDHGVVSGDGGTYTQIMDIRITQGASDLLNEQVTSSSSSYYADQLFSHYSFTFTPIGSEATTLSFTDSSLTTTSHDGYLDNIQVVPEPSIIALILFGWLFLFFRRLKWEG